MRTLPFLALALLPFAAAAQDRDTTTVEIVGHVNEPTKLAPTPERLANVGLPDGFRLTKFASVQNPRILAVNGDGTIYVSGRIPGTVTMMRDTDGDGVADVQAVVFKREKSHGLAIHNGFLYVVTVKEIYRAPILKTGFLGKIELLKKDLPDGGQHQNRTIAFGPDGKMYVSCGSTANATNESDPRSATILQMDDRAKDEKIYASGLRNTIGFGWHPVSRRMFGMDHGIDWLGDNDQKEEFNEILPDHRYGWPYIYADGKENPQDEPPAGYTMDSWRAMSTEPLMLYTAHSAPLQMAFYTGSMFPAEYRNEGFQTMRGSWNRLPASGYEIVRVRYDANGAPQKIEPFLTGFLQKGAGEGGKEAHIGRLVGLAQAKDGAMLFTDDTNNIVYRISYGEGEPATMPDQDGLTIDKPNLESPQTSTAAPKAAELKVRADAFSDGGAIPDTYSNYGGDKSPAMTWSGVPAGTKSLVVLVEDPDALSPKPFVHWLAADLPANLTRLGAGVPTDPKPAALAGGVQGGGHSGTVGYFGPRPPAGDPPHRYHFEVFALDTKLNLPPGFTRAALTKAMAGHVLAKGETVGTYERKG